MTNKAKKRATVTIYDGEAGKVYHTYDCVINNRDIALTPHHLRYISDCLRLGKAIMITPNFTVEVKG